ncbi:MAG: class II fructose-bisphosphate aldolase, partial [Clostridia bacterium]|nr:class II fructose-bisphosphate aldolase [Clostridia bacterium]
MLVNLNDVLKQAQKEHYAVGLFNTTDSDMLEAAISAAEELNSPIVIGTAEVLLPHGELKLIAPGIVAAAKRAKVPVVVHYDHGLTFDRCIEALQLGFSSIMFDGSANDYDENLRATAEIVKIAHSMGVSVEGEIGHVGNADT